MTKACLTTSKITINHLHCKRVVMLTLKKEHTICNLKTWLLVYRTLMEAHTSSKIHTIAVQ